MSVTDYKDAKKAGDRLNDTLFHNAVSAYVQAEQDLMDADGLVDKSKLKDKSTRSALSKKVYNALVGVALTYFGAATTDQTRQEQLAFGLFGMNTPTIQKFMDDNEEKAGIFEFLNYAQRNTAFGYFMRQNNTERPKTKLEDTDADEVVNLTNTATLVNKNKLTIDDMVELLAEHEEHGTVRPNFLKGKRYAI